MTYCALENHKNEIMANMGEKARAALSDIEEIRKDQKNQLDDAMLQADLFLEERLAVVKNTA